jgi:trehalose-6-phosphate synthase
MIQVAIPSREDVKEYRDLVRSLQQQVNQINRRHGKNDLDSSNDCCQYHPC